MRRFALVLTPLALGLAFLAAGCGSSDPSPGTAGVAQSTGTVPSGRLGGAQKKTNIQIINRSGRNILVDICHDGHCNGHTTLKDGQADQAAGDNVYGWVRSSWGMGNGYQDNQYTGVRGSAPGPYFVDFRAGNPAVGQPWIEASLPRSCLYQTANTPGGGNDKSVRWTLGVGERDQSPGNSLCTYGMVGSRQADGGADRLTGARADYKQMVLEVYAPKPVYVSGRGCTWEHTPGPVIKPESPDGSWSCWDPGPRPPADVAVTYETP
jgi:hypothetical protein